jgi:hypothetical protein
VPTLKQDELLETNTKGAKAAEPQLEAVEHIRPVRNQSHGLLTICIDVNPLTAVTGNMKKK